MQQVKITIQQINKLTQQNAYISPFHYWLAQGQWISNQSVTAELISARNELKT